MNRILVLSPRASLYKKYEALTRDVVASGQSGHSAIPTQCWPWPWEVGVAANPRHPGGITCCPSPSALLPPGPQKDTAPSAWAPEWTHGTDLNPTRSLQPKVRAPVACKPRGENKGRLLATIDLWVLLYVVMARANEHIFMFKKNIKSETNCTWE